MNIKIRKKKDFKKNFFFFSDALLHNHKISHFLIQNKENENLYLIYSFILQYVSFIHLYIHLLKLLLYLFLYLFIYTYINLYLYLFILIFIFIFILIYKVSIF